jgi:Permuted papain-like amidase enzyme, YaeF/YiiX, C92 family
LRASLLATIEEIGVIAGAGRVEWNSRQPLFTTAFAAACILMRANRFIVDLASKHSVLWKKLDEEDKMCGIPRKSFTTIYQALTSPRNQLRFLNALDHYTKHRDEIHALTNDPVMQPIVDLLDSEEPFIEKSRREAVKRRISYRWFSFLRSHRSAWKNVMRGMFEVAGRAVSELRQPGIKPIGAPKRIHAELQKEILKLVQPGDVFVTRHDDAMSNLFLPGFWPHAALFLGKTANSTPEWGQLSSAGESDAWFLESLKDGVKVRPSKETLTIDALVVLRPPLAGPDIQRGLQRALTHLGKPYDFLFDFRTADRLVCTEVIYRGFHGIAPVQFQLREVGGRLCLPAEEFIDQALACGFQLILTAGLQGDVLLTGPEAERAFRASRPARVTA